MTTTKPKTTKAKSINARKPAAKATAPALATSGEPREVSEIRTLVSRWRWLEADQEYQAQTADTEEKSEKLITVHNDEQEKIEAALAALVPESMYDISCLLGFIIERADQFSFQAAEKDMLRNIRGSILGIYSTEKEKACKVAVEKAQEEMRHKVRCSIETSEWFEAQIAELVDKHHAEQAKRKAA